MNIRDFREDDLGVVAEIYALSKLDELRYEEEDFEILPLERDVKRFQEFMASQKIVYDCGGIRGYGAVFGNEIRALFVHPQSRGRGIGKCLLEYLIAKAGTYAKLYVAKNNTPAKALYRNFGFAVTREFDTFYNGKPVLANEMIRVED